MESISTCSQTSRRVQATFSNLFQLLEFAPNVTKQDITLKVYHIPETSLRTAFTLHLNEDANRFAQIGLGKAIVYIEEQKHKTGVTFPLNPLVVSLKDYDDAKAAQGKLPPQGYPLICISVSIELIYKFHYVIARVQKLL